MAQRPIGISVIAVLEALVGIVLFLLAALIGALSTAGSFLQSWIETYMTTYVPNIGDLITAIMLAIAAVFAILGILSLVSAYGLWTGRGWAWYLSVILLVISIILWLLSIPGSPAGGIIGLIISGLILWYFFRPYVRAFFGQGPAPQPPPPPPPAPAPAPQ